LVDTLAAGKAAAYPNLQLVQKPAPLLDEIGCTLSY